MDRPLRFVPFLRPMIWGGRRLGEVLGKPLEPGIAYGESWEISAHPLHRSLVAAGLCAGRTLRELMETCREELLGPAAAKHAVFPWLVKFLDACDWLSVQVHPDDDSVQRLWPGEGGKTEAWFVLDAAPGSRIYAGLLPGVDEKRLRQALAAGTVADCLHSFTPRPGDCIFLQAGTVHAVGGGVLLAEVQQTSDATFRLFDWGRRDSQGKSRPLHVEEAMACIDWSRGPVTAVRAEGFAGGGPQRQELVSCPYFRWEFVREAEPFEVGGDGRLGLLMVLQGRGTMATQTGEEELLLGQAWLLPASMPPMTCRPHPSLGVLLCTLP